MESFEADGNGNGNGLEESLPPPPPEVPSDVIPVKLEEVLPVKAPPEQPVKKKPARLPVARKGLGTKGVKIALLTNHYKVNVTNNDGYFFHYSVCPSHIS